MTAVAALRSTALRRPRWRLRRVAGGALAAALVGGTAFALIGIGGGDDESPPGRSAGAPVDYQITYRVTDAAGPVVEEDVAVSRPFRSSIRAGDAGRRSDAGVLATVGGDGQWLRIEVPVAPASGDLRIDAVLGDAVAAGHVEPGPRRRIAGTSCREHRFGGPVSSGVLTPVGAVPGEHAEVCIDDRGLVLAERWVVDGELRWEREAVRIRVGSIDDGRFVLPGSARALSFADGGGASTPVDADHDAGFAERWRLAGVPDGFEHVGRWLVVPPALERPEPGQLRDGEVALVTDAWRRGADLLLLDQGATAAGVAPPWDQRPVQRRMPLGALGAVDVAWDLRASEVRVVRPDNGFVRVAGTLPPGDLVDVARTLTTIPTPRGGAS